MSIAIGIVMYLLAGMVVVRVTGCLHNHATPILGDYLSAVIVWPMVGLYFIVGLRVPTWLVRETGDK